MKHLGLKKRALIWLFCNSPTWVTHRYNKQSRLYDRRWLFKLLWNA